MRLTNLLTCGIILFAAEPSRGQLIEERARLQSEIAATCGSNVFRLSPVESVVCKRLRGRLEVLDAQYRIRAYEKAGRDHHVPPHVLMAICEGFNPEGLARESRCAEEWGAFLTGQSIAQIGATLDGVLDQGRAAGIPVRAQELGFAYWPEQMPGSDRSVSYTASSNGHFVLPVELDGVEVLMLVDTGASIVVLTARDAVRIGIDPRHLRYSVPLHTAAGQEDFASAMVRDLRLAGLHLQNVPVLVARPGGMDQVSLLGAPVLNSFSRLELSGSELTLVP